MGDYINAMFEAQMAWYYDNGVVYISGRDVVCIAVGICIGIIFVLFMILVEEGEKSMAEEKKPSFKMKKGVKLCEDMLGVKCEDMSFDGVKKFLDENMPKLKDIDMREHKEPSDKQMYAIDFIENVLEGVEFKGKTMKDASNFISEYYEKAKEVSESNKK